MPRWLATTLGAAAVASGLGPDDAILLHKELALARKALNTECELHAMYLATDLREQLGKLDWERVHETLGKLKVGGHCGGVVPGHVRTCSKARKARR